MKIAQILLLLFLADIVKSDLDLELVCLIFSMGTTRERVDEVNDYLLVNSHLSKQDLSEKLTDDGYSLCISRITIEEAYQIGLRRIKDFKHFSHLIYIELDKYKTKEDLILSETYKVTRKQLGTKMKEYKRQKSFEF